MRDYCCLLSMAPSLCAFLSALWPDIDSFYHIYIDNYDFGA